MSKTITVVSLAALGIAAAPIALAAARGTAEHIYWQFDRDYPESALEPGLYKAEDCPACNSGQGFLGSIPVLRRLAVKAVCGSCSGMLPYDGERWAIAAMALGGLAGAVAETPGAALCLAVFFWMLLSLSAADMRDRLLPDAIVYPMILAGLIVADSGLTPVTTSGALMGLAFGYLPIAGGDWLMRKLTGRMAFGGGDAKLCGAIGAWVGLSHLTSVLVIAGLLLLMVGVGLRVAGRVRAGQYLCFGPALALAGICIASEVHAGFLPPALIFLIL